MQDTGNDFPDGILRLLDSSGNLLWYKTFGTMSSDYFEAICPSHDLGFVMCGTTQPSGNPNIYGQIYAVKTNEVGETIWEHEFGELYFIDNYGYTICQAADGGYVFCGLASGGNQGAQVYVVKINENGSSVGVEELIKWNNLEVFPNPFHESTQIKFNEALEGETSLKVYSSDGKLVFTETLKSGIVEYDFHKNNLNSGTYILSLQNGKIITNKRITIY